MKNIVKEYTLKYEPTQHETRTIKDSRESYEAVKDIFDPDTLPIYESFYAVYLNRSLKIKGFMKIGQGGLTNTVADPRLVLIGALESLSTDIIIAHNHPSGNPSPSTEDRNLTKRMKAACDLLDIGLLDHIIIGGNGKYYSFRDNGEMIL